MILSLGLSAALGAVSGGIQGYGGYKSAKLQAHQARMQGIAESYAHKMNAERELRERENIHSQTQQELWSFDMGMKQTLDDIRYQYASAGISTASGSGAQAMNSNISQASLQRELISEAGTGDMLNMSLSAMYSKYAAEAATANAEYTAKRLTRIGKENAWLSVLGGAVSGLFR